MSSVQFKKDLVNNTKSYYLGLDIGTSTIGYAISDKKYNVIKKGRKSLWGVYQFYAANTAADRRGFRTGRRNKDRRKQRVELLQEYFSEEISKIDFGFYLRMKDSFFYPDDKQELQTNSLFNDENFKDQDYHDLYPTIYHLRDDLMFSNKKKDIRLVYLALHHLMKHRGHFLFEGKNIDVEGQLREQLELLVQSYRVLYQEDLWMSDSLEKIISILSNVKTTSNEKKKELDKCLVEATLANKELNKLVIGNKVQLNKIFDDETLLESDLNKFQLSDSSFEENIDSYSDLLGDSFSLILNAQGIYSAVILDRLLSDQQGNRFNSVSSARIAIYEQHKEDLRTLKELVRWFDKIFKKKLYTEMFRANEKDLNNYVAFSGHIDSADSVSPIKRCSHDDFQKICWFSPKEDA